MGIFGLGKKKKQAAQARAEKAPSAGVPDNSRQPQVEFIEADPEESGIPSPSAWSSTAVATRASKPAKPAAKKAAKKTSKGKGSKKAAKPAKKSAKKASKKR